MFELKIIQAANSVYRGIVRLGIRSLERRDVKATENLIKANETADDLRESAKRLTAQADFIEKRAAEDYRFTVRDVNAGLNALQNNMDDSTFKA